MTETFTGSRSIANEMSGQANVQVQIPLVGVGMQAQGNLGVIDTFGDSRAIAATMESSNTQFAGFLVNPNECPGSLNFNFLYHVEIWRKLQKVTDSSCMLASTKLFGQRLLVNGFQWIGRRLVCTNSKLKETLLPSEV
jgi:hypothetical protein